MNTLNADSTPHFPDLTWESYVNDLPETPKVRRKPAPKYPPGLGLGAAVTRPTPSRTQTFGITKHDPRRISNPRDILYHTPRPLTPEQQAKLAALKKQYENSPSIGSPLRDSSYIEQLNRLKAVYEKRESAGVLSAFHRNHDEGLRFLPYCRQGKCIDRTQKRCTYCKSEASDEAKGLYRARVFRIMEAAAQEAFEDPWDSCLRMKTRQDYLAFARYCENASKVVYTALDGIDLCPIAEIEVVFGDFDEEWIAKFWRAMKRRYEVDDEEEERKQRAERKRVNEMLKEEEKENVAV
ncbi:hypothetical protein EUX98_g6330 [Antrodiella citrinella]|uniref:Uncharacterized protein n=1 Tax=Antrodiella citrinella TaxID=2447956 RepID=A0A4S4MR48_9APHY|nr:hypothetical protein EUX98_g6330 [Antrodiella citrinella]